MRRCALAMVAFGLAVGLSACGSAGSPTGAAATTTGSVFATTTTSAPAETFAPTTSVATTSTSQATVPALGGAYVDAVTSDGAVVTLDSGAVYSVDSADQSTASTWTAGDTISVGINDDSLADLDTNESVSATDVGNSSDSNVYPNAGDHTQQTNSGDGNIVVLDDGSIWEVALTDQSTAALWLDLSSITVTGDSSGPPYTLVNTDDQSSVQASYVGDE